MSYSHSSSCLRPMAAAPQPPAYSRPQPPSLPLALFLLLSSPLLCLSFLPCSFSCYLSHKYRLLTLPNTWSVLINSVLGVGLMTEKTSPGVKAGVRKGVEVSGTRMRVRIQDVDEDGSG